MTHVFLFASEQANLLVYYLIMVVSSTINKSTETLNSKFYSWVSSNTFSPFPTPNNVDLFYFFSDGAGHSTYTTLNWGTRGTSELLLDANEIELGGLI